MPGVSRRKTWLRRTIAAIVLAAAVPAIALAQSFQGSVRGTVKDNHGVIPGASVSLVNQSTGATHETITNGVGEFSFPAVDPARYTLAIDVAGFKSWENTNILVATLAQIDIPVALDVATLEENVTVTVAVPLIETGSASQSNTLTVQNFRELPSEGRSVFLMGTLEPDETTVLGRRRPYFRWASVLEPPSR